MVAFFLGALNGLNNVYEWLHLHELTQFFLPAGDRNLTETIVNVVTSLPFIALGLQAPRHAH